MMLSEVVIVLEIKLGEDNPDGWEGVCELCGFLSFLTVSGASYRYSRDNVFCSVKSLLSGNHGFRWFDIACER
jgi:hypothetical protein